MDGHPQTLALWAVGFLVQAILLAIAGTWKLSGVVIDLRKEISMASDNVRAGIDAERRDIGESLSAIRQKIQDVELDGAKTYSRRDSFHQAMGQLQETFGKSDAAAEQRMLRIEEKIDTLTRDVARVAAKVPGAS